MSNKHNNNNISNGRIRNNVETNLVYIIYNVERTICRNWQ